MDLMRLRVLITALGCLVCLRVSAQTPTVDQIVAKNIEAKGGLARLRTVQTIKRTSQMSMQGKTATMVAYGKRPNLVRQEISVDGQTVVNAFDGQDPWIINPLVGTSTPIVVTGPQAEAIRAQSSFDDVFVDFQAHGYRIALAGVETQGGKRTYHLQITDRSGQVQQYYLDAETGLETRILTQQPGGTFEQDLSDYRDVEGIKVPFSIRTLVNGVLQSEITVSKVEFNVPVDDRLFRMAR